MTGSFYERRNHLGKMVVRNINFYYDNVQLTFYNVVVCTATNIEWITWYRHVQHVVIHTRYKQKVPNGTAVRLYLSSYQCHDHNYTSNNIYLSDIKLRLTTHACMYNHDIILYRLFQVNQPSVYSIGWYSHIRHSWLGLIQK